MPAGTASMPKDTMRFMGTVPHCIESNRCCKRVEKPPSAGENRGTSSNFHQGKIRSHYIAPTLQ